MFNVPLFPPIVDATINKEFEKCISLYSVGEATNGKFSSLLIVYDTMLIFLKQSYQEKAFNANNVRR